MRYIEITARVAAADAESAADALRDALDAGVSIEAPFVQPDLESDAIVDAVAPRVLRAYIPMDAPRTEAAITAACNAFAERGINSGIEQAEVAEEDWAESWKEHFHIERFGQHLVVVPTWRRFDPQSGDITIALDPGMAFGTGQHETTRMCLEALESAVRPGARVLDVGCGSGILAIAAARLGAREVLALDIDANCARITAENARLNGVAIDARTGTLDAVSPTAGFDLVVANIIARVIIEIAPQLVAALAPDGRLIVSGVIGEREAETVAALTGAGAAITSVRAMGDWRCIEAMCR